jgi:hypothetical protein
MKIESRKDGRVIYKSDLRRGDLVILPTCYMSIGGMRGIILDLYDGLPDENDDVYEHCRIMLEDGEFENLVTWDLEKVESPK